MIFNLYSMEDKLAGIYYQPFQCSAHPVALRLFTELTNDPTSMVYNNPSDYYLVQVGTFDDSTGIISPYSAPAIIAHALTLKSEYKDNEISNGAPV